MEMEDAPTSGAGQPARESGSSAEGKGLLSSDGEESDDEESVGMSSEATQWRRAPVDVLRAGTIILLLTMVALAPRIFSDFQRSTNTTQSSPTIQRAAAPPLIVTTAAAPPPHAGAPRSRRERRAERRRQRRRTPPGPADTASLERVHTHIIPQGGSLAIECAAGTKVIAGTCLLACVLTQLMD